MMENKLFDFRSCEKTVYYYCTHNVFNSIITNKSVWLADMLKTNDYAEIIYTMSSVVDAFDKQLEKKTFSFDDEENAYIQDKISKLVKKRCNSILSNCFWLAICFSSQGDDLSQWRAYGNDGKGYAIGFDLKKLKEFVRHPLFRVDNICYDEIEKNEAVAIAIAKLFSTIMSIKNKHGILNDCNRQLSKPIQDYVRDWSMELSNNIAFYKSSDFAAEKETRWCYSRMIYQSQLEKVADSSKLKHLRFSVKEKDIVAYLEEPIDLNLISEIVIGPTNNVTEYDMKMYLCSKGIDVKNVSIKKSHIPYRSK